MNGRMACMAAAGCMAWQAAAGADVWRVASPDGRVVAEVKAGGGAPAYVVTLAGQEALGESPLGIVRDDAAFDRGLVFVSEQRAKISDEFALPTGKQRRSRVEGNEMTLAFKNAAGAPLEIVFRAYDDGVAFRYRFPGDDATVRTVTGEQTGFQLPAGSKAWVQPYDEATKWTPAYERFFENGVAAGAPTTNRAGWCFPALFRAGGQGPWVLLTEAMLDGSYCGCRLASEAPGGLYRVRFPDAAEGLGTGEVAPKHGLPWATPWRVVLVGDTPKPIVESTMVAHLNPPSALADTSWIKPGRVAWSWWSEQDSPKKPERMKDFIDMAAELGWEYFLVDANWNFVEESKLLDLYAYAKQKNVGLLLWYNSGGPHNEVSEAPRDRMMPADVRRKELARLKELGIKGVKVDFFQSDKQNIVQHYLDILQDAAAAGIMVNFHGCTMQRGWARTWPNLMTMEGVRGAECYIFDKKFPEMAPSHNTILAFTRNVCGSMDYTPVTFSDNNNPHKTTMGHELALSVVFESGWMHFADGVKGYRSAPDFVRQYLREVPVVWDETRFLAGEPGKLAVLARRNGNDWYVGGINGEDAATSLKLSLDFLDGNGWTAHLVTDGAVPREFAQKTWAVDKSAPFAVELKPFGGFALQLRRK